MSNATNTTTTTTTVTSDTAALQNALTAAIAKATSYPETYGGPYNVFKGAYSGNSAYYFLQVATANAHFYVNVNVGITFNGQTCVSTETNAFASVTTPAGVTTYSNACAIHPQQSKPSCSYIMSVTSGTPTVALTLGAWGYE